MGARLRVRDLSHLSPGAPAERPATGRENEPAHLARCPATKALRQRRVFRVHRHDLARLGPIGDQGAAGNEGLLVRQRERAAGVQGGQRRRQADRTRHGVEHDVARPGGDLAGGVRSGHDFRQPHLTAVVPATLSVGVEGKLEVLRGTRSRDGDHIDVELERLLREQRDVATAGGEPDNAEPLGTSPHEVDGLGADRAGGAEHDDVTLR